MTFKPVHKRKPCSTSVHRLVLEAYSTKGLQGPVAINQFSIEHGIHHHPLHVGDVVRPEVEFFSPVFIEEGSELPREYPAVSSMVLLNKQSRQYTALCVSLL